MTEHVNSKILTSSDGARIYADASGNPNKPSIVFVHGQALSGAVFDSIFSNKRYTDEFYLVRYDMRGHGRSDKPDNIESHASKLFADDFAAVVKAFNLHKPVLVGWSLGGAVGADIAAHLPEDTLSGIVYLAGVAYLGPILLEFASTEVLSMSAALQNDNSVSSFVDVAKAFVDACFIDAPKIPWALRCLWLGMAANQRPIHRKFALERQQDPARLLELGRKGFPILVLGGKHDKQVYSDKLAEVLRPHFTAMEVCIIEKNGSHAVFYENTEEVMSKIIEFIRKVKAEASHSSVRTET